MRYLQPSWLSEFLQSTDDLLVLISRRVSNQGLIAINVSEIESDLRQSSLSDPFSFLLLRQQELWIFVEIKHCADVGANRWFPGF